MKNSRKDFDKELYEAFRRADDLSLEEYNKLYPHPCNFKEFVSREDTKHTEEFTSSVYPKKRSFIVRLRYIAAILAIVVLMPLVLSSGKSLKFTKEHGYTIAESIKGYEYYKVHGHYYFFTDEEYMSYQEIGPIHRKYVPTYIPDSCSYTYYDYNETFSWHSVYSFYEIDEETGEYISDVRVFIFTSGTDTAGTGKKMYHHPEIIELPNGDHGVLVKGKDRLEMCKELFWANDEISILITTDKLPIEELIKILEGIEYTTEFTE